MHTLNLGILAHVDAGKTSLTERLLHHAGAVDELGSVDAGSTQTDTLELERRRGITIRSAVASFVVGDVRVNLIDTPGHPDFIAEVDRVLGVLDGAVLVVSAVEGVQPQTRVLVRALRRLAIPTVVFVNKIDRRGAAPHKVVARLAEQLGSAVVAMGRVVGAGTAAAAYVPHDPGDRVAGAALAELLADGDDALMTAYVAGATAPGFGLLATALADQTARGLVHPVLLGSAATGAGVAELCEALPRLLPCAAGAADAPLSGLVFKIERGRADERLAYVRLFAGTLRTRDRLDVGPALQTVTAIDVVDGGRATRTDVLRAGQIGRLTGPAGLRVGDPVGARPASAGGARPFGPPTLEAVVEPTRPEQRRALHAALVRLADEDPLIAVRRDVTGRDLAVSLFGEVQKEVLTARLGEELGIDVVFRASSTIHVERLTGTGTASDVIGEGDNPFLATVGLRVEPGEVGGGTELRLEVELGSLPAAFMTAISETVPLALGEGLHGWAVQDCVVTLTRSGYWARQSSAHGGFDKRMSSTAGEFRNLTALVLGQAVAAAGTVVCEPMKHFRLELPGDAVGQVRPVLARLGAVVWPPTARGRMTVLEGELAAARVHELTQLVPGTTNGEGVLETVFERYQPVRGTPPTRARTRPDPYDRRAYLLAVEGRGAASRG